MGKNTRCIGVRGENRIVNYITSNGMYVIDHSFYFSHFSEVDIFAYDNGTLVAVEVKYLQNSIWDKRDISRWVNKNKLEKMRRTTRVFMKRTLIPYTSLRLDVAFIMGGSITYYKGVNS